MEGMYICYTMLFHCSLVSTEPPRNRGHLFLLVSLSLQPPPQLKPFDSELFLKGMEGAGPHLTSRVKGNWTGLYQWAMTTYFCRPTLLLDTYLWIPLWEVLSFVNSTFHPLVNTSLSHWTFTCYVNMLIPPHMNVPVALLSLAHTNLYLSPSLLTFQPLAGSTHLWM